MASFYIRVDEHTPMLIKALIKYGSYKQNYYASELGIKPSNLSAYLNGKKKMSKELCAALLELIGFDPANPYIIINKNKLINS
tara:strand:+ start:945 stop:1193 length:249 start_codon:yes stop_codon:yes gene_type:complete